MEKRPFLSVIIPLYNEEKRIGNIAHVVKYLSHKQFSWELILVDDGSLDNTKKVAGEIVRKNSGLISYSMNRGKGHAIKQGMLAASGLYRLFMDIDLSTPIAEFEKFIPFLGKYDCLIGTRKAKGAKVSVHQPWIRENLGKGFTFLSQLVLGMPVSDFTCGFKSFSAPCARQVFQHSRISRWGFDSEILFLCHKYSFSIKEIPVTWKNDPRTRVRFPHDIFKSFSELLTVRLNDLRGLYHLIQA